MEGSGDDVRGGVDTPGSARTADPDHLAPVDAGHSTTSPALGAWICWPLPM